MESYTRYSPGRQCVSLPNISMLSVLEEEPESPSVTEIIEEFGLINYGRVSSMALLDIEEKIEDVIIFENETAVFEYKLEQYIKTPCTWHGNGILLESDTRTSITVDGGWHRLEIREVTSDDQGIYTLECQYRNRYISVKGHLYVTPRGIRDGAYYHKTPFTRLGVERHLCNTKVLTGKTFTLCVNSYFIIEFCIWYKNNKILGTDKRIIKYQDEFSVSLVILNAELTDTGVYCVVAKTTEGIISSIADVQVMMTSDEKLTILPIVEEHLPEEIEALYGEETRLVLKAHIDTETRIIWELNNVLIESKDYVQVDYGNNYIGLNILNPSNSSVGEYKVSLVHKRLNRVVSSGTRLTLNHPPVPPAAINVVHPVESAIACCGATVSFDCSFNLENPLFYYVVWYVGHYKVERTNSLFDVICSGGQFVLFINKVDLNMAGEVRCELRRSSPNNKSVHINKTQSYLVIIPESLIEDTKKNTAHESKLYFVRESPEFPIRIEANNFYGLTEEVSCADVLLMVACCRLNDDGLFFVHVTRGPITDDSTKIEFLDSSGVNRKIHTKVKWSDYMVIPEKTWFGIDLRQSNGSFISAAITSHPYFEFENPPLHRMFIFRIQTVKPQSIESEVYEVFIVLPREIVLRQPVHQGIQPMEAFDKMYTTTNDIIGTGGFGSVVMVQNKDDGLQYAAKFVKLKPGQGDHTLREFHIMKKLHHPKLIELIGFYESSQVMVFVMEYCWGGELFDRIAVDENLKELDVVGYVKQICEALEYLHTHSIAHLDLKPENIICLSPNSRQVKLIDFGLAKNVNNDSMKTIYGTKEYLAPEMINFDPISTACDMWSLGVVTYTLLSGLTPFAGDNWFEQSVNITSVRYNYDDYIFNNISNWAKNFIDLLLLRQPEKRITASEALQHKWIKEGPPKGTKAKHMSIMRKNLKSYLEVYRLRWQRAANVVIAAHRLRMRAHHQADPQEVAGSSNIDD